jgi:7-carboxy-7-deazaguanine synthase
VLCDRADYEWARALLREQTLDQRTEVLFSPSYGQLAPQDLAAWILQDRLPVRFQWQLHKQLWGDVPGR